MRSLLFIIYFVAFSLIPIFHAQIIPATTLDRYLDLPVEQKSNTGVTIPPDIDLRPGGTFDYSVVVNDIPSQQEINIIIVDNNRGSATPFVREVINLFPTGDPDVASVSVDEFYVVYEEYGLAATQIVLEQFANVGSLPQLFQGTNKYYMGSGNLGDTYPNLDINSVGEGAVVFVDMNGFINVQAFNVSPGFLHGDAAIIIEGSQPDITVHDNSTVSITFIDKHGNLAIHTGALHSTLMGGIFAPSQDWVFPRKISFNAPRIASLHNVGSPNGSHEMFTVVASSPMIGHIKGYFFDGVSVNDVLINHITAPCAQDDYPVVSYQWNKVVVAWSSVYTSCVGGGSGSGTGTLKEELDFFGNSITGYMYSEVNFDDHLNFVTTRPALTSEYDGLTALGAGKFHESCVYYAINDPSLIWKNRSNIGSTSQFYKKKGLNSFDESKKKFIFINNPIEKKMYIELNSSSPKFISMTNLLGHELMSLKLSFNEKSFVLDYSDLPTGLLFVTGRTKNVVEATSIINR